MNKIFEQIFNEKIDWFEDIGESFENFAENISNAVIGESPSLNETRIGNPDYITYLIRAEKSYLKIKTKLEFYDKRNPIEKRNNFSNNEPPSINVETAPSVCVGINSSTDRIRRLKNYLNSVDNEFKKAILSATIMIYKKMLDSLREYLETYNSNSVNTPVPIPEEFYI